MLLELLSFEKIFVLVVIIFILISLYSGMMGTAITFFVAVISLGLVGILSPAEMLSGFAKEEIMVILMLLLIGDIIRKTGVIEVVFDKLFSSAKSERGFMARMMVIVGAFSAFLNNTPLVVLMMPYVNHWCKKSKISPSRFLIPLSYAAILGGCTTLIGTSTNLIVNGLFGDQNIISEAQLLKYGLISELGEVPTLGIFQFAWVGVPMLIIGFLYIIFIGEKILPSKGPLDADLPLNAPKYVFETQVRRKSHLIGSTLKKSGLLEIEGMFLFEMFRHGAKIDIKDELELQQGDLLFFTGETESIVELIEPKSGLTFSEVGTFHKKDHTEIVEVVISQNSTLIRKTTEEINFRARFDATILAIHRNGEKISGKISQVRLKAGDALLLLASAAITKRTSPQEFYFISRVKEIKKNKPWKVAILLIGTTLAIIVSAMGLLSLFKALALLLVIILFFKIANAKDLAKSVDYNLAMTIALAFAFDHAMINTDVAKLLASGVISIFMPAKELSQSIDITLFQKVGLLASIYALTAILASYITNVPAVAIIFPISMTTASQLGLDPTPFILVVSFAAAANFITPVGYQTNLMVYGPGKYSFKDFFKIGVPLTALYMTATVSILSFMYF